MSLAISLKNPAANRSGAALTFIQICLLLAGLLSAFGLLGVALHDQPGDTVERAPAAVPAQPAMVAVDAADDLAVLSEQPQPSPKPAVAASVSAAAIAVPTATPASVLSPRMQGALDYVKRRYKVAPEALVPVFEVAQLIGKEMRIDPLLIVAIIGIESGFNPFAESSMGARGLMQIIPRFHRDKVPPGAGDGSLLDPLVNIRVGVQVLEEAIRRTGSLVSGLQRYAGSSEPEGLYAAKVLAEKERLEQAARRNSPVDASAEAA